MARRMLHRFLVVLYRLYLWLSHSLISLSISIFISLGGLFQKGNSTDQVVAQVLVAGGGFAGILAARSIAEQSRLLGIQTCVTLLDQKQFFEFTPSILRALVDPKECETILIPFSNTCLRSSGITFYQARMEGVDTEKLSVHLKEDAKNAVDRPYDCILLANGTPYANKVIRDWSSLTLEGRRQRLLEEHQRLLQARCIVVAGGATTGVELAAELAAVLPKMRGKQRKLYLVSAADKLLPCSPPKASQYAYTRLVQLGVEVILQDMVIDVKEDAVSSGCSLGLQSGRVLDCDAFYLCAMFGTSLIQGIPTHPGGIPVNEYLQVEGQAKIFAAGDAVEAPLVCGCGGDRCGKSAYIAENTAAVAAANVVRTLKGQQGMLTPFPGTPAARLPTVECITIGRWDGIVIINSLVLPGLISIPVKQLIKYSKLDDVNGGLLGRLLWLIIDTTAPFLGRLIPAAHHSLPRAMIVKPKKA